MGSKLLPGDYDCYSAAMPDEPMFVLLARDRSAPSMLRAWSDARRRQLHAKHDLGEIGIDDLGEGLRKCTEADGCADDMILWRKANDGRWRDTSELRPRLGDPTPDQMAQVESAVVLLVGNALGLVSQFHGVIAVTAHKARPWRSPLLAGRVHQLELTLEGRAFDLDPEVLSDISSMTLLGMMVADLTVFLVTADKIAISVSVVVD